MRFSPKLLDEIRARVPVSLVVSRKVALKSAGRELKGLSPFKQERHDTKHAITYVVHYLGAPIRKLRRAWASVGGGNDGPHICRHTAATWLMQGRVDIYEAAGYLGMTPETLWSTYGHHHPDFQKSAATATGKRQRLRVTKG